MLVLIDGAGVHLSLIDDLASLDQAFFHHSFGVSALVLEDQIGAVGFGFDLDCACPLQVLQAFNGHILAADALVFLVFVLDVDLARFARRHADDRIFELPQGGRLARQRTRVAGDDDLVLGLIEAGEGVLHIGHVIIEGGIYRVLVQNVMPIPEDRLALAVEEELAPLGGGDIADAAIDIEGVLELIRVAALAHPVVAHHVQRQRAFLSSCYRLPDWRAWSIHPACCSPDRRAPRNR